MDKRTMRLLRVLSVFCVLMAIGLRIDGHWSAY